MDRKGFADEHILGTMIIVTRDPTIVDKIIHDPSFTAEQLETKLAQGFALLATDPKKFTDSLFSKEFLMSLDLALGHWVHQLIHG